MMSEERKTAYQRFLEDFNKNTTTDRIDYPFLILEALRMINLMRTAENYDSSRVDSAIVTLCDMIPDEVRDSTFMNAVEEAKYIEVEDCRILWWTERIGPKTVENQREIVRIDHSKLLHAIVGLVHRMELGLKTEKKGFVGSRVEE